MPISKLVLKNFRCFKHAEFNFSTPVTIIEGSNGSGKSSLLEALHYGCYLRSFRTSTPSDMISDLQNDFYGFALQVTTDEDIINIGVNEKKRTVKVNNVPVTRYKELIDVYKVITFIEEDLTCLRGYPESRRVIIDNAISLQDPHYYNLLRSARVLADQRTKLLQEFPVKSEHYALWTDQLKAVTDEIVKKRKEYIALLQQTVNNLAHIYGQERIVTINYRQKREIESDEEKNKLFFDEMRVRKGLYGPHLDDIEFLIYERNSRSFSSRGQQKLAIMLIKIAQMQLLKMKSMTFLIDDFLTDFDPERITKIFNLLTELEIQLIITTPQPHDLLYSLCTQHGPFNKIHLADL